MDYTRVPDAQGNKADKRPTDSTPNPTKNDKRPFRRVRSPSRPRAWLSSSQFHKPRFSRDDRSFHKAGFSNYRYHHLKPRAYFNRRDYPPPKPRHIAPNKREKEKVREKEEERGNEWYGQRESTDGSSPSKQSNTSRAVIPWATSSRDEDIQITVFQDERIQSSERDHRSSKSKSKDRERSRDGELPLTASQMAARDRAIQQKRREIDEVYYQECEIFGLVAKMLIAKDPSLERPIQSSLQENLRDIGTRCVEAMEKFIEDYDSRELLHFSDQ